MKPIGKNIIVKTIDEEVTTDSGLVLSGEDVKSMRYRKAIVISAGTEVAYIKTDDIIYYDKSHGFTMLIENKPHTIIQERDVVVVL
jgi:co-chaperonin GroES (HSP10)